MATEDRAPKHGRHAAGKHAAQPKAATPSVPLGGGEETSAPATGYDVAPTPLDQVMPTAPITDGDQELALGDAPVPIGVDPEETGSFSRITATQGARVTTRANASETASMHIQAARPIEAVRMSSAGRPHVERHEAEVEANGRVFAVLGLAAVLVVLVVGWLVIRALVSVDRTPEKTVVEQTQVGLGESIEYHEVTYALTELEGGGYALTSTAEDQEAATTICELQGTPVALILYNTIFVIPENLGDGTWDLIAHPLGGGSMTQQVTDAEGNPLIGNGEISEATLVGDAIQVMTTTGESYTVSLQ